MATHSCSDTRPAEDAVATADMSDLEDMVNPEELMIQAADFRSKRRYQDAIEIYDRLSKAIHADQGDNAPISAASSLPSRARAELAYLTEGVLGRHVEAISLLRSAVEEMHAHLELSNAEQQQNEELVLACANAEVKLARLTRSTPATLPHPFVRALFDDFAATFDHKLRERLAYRAPEALCDAILMHRQAQLAADPASFGSLRFRACLDLGAGTGIMGELLRPHCSVLHGVELSGEMARKAEEKDLYDAMYVHDLHDHLQSLIDGSSTSEEQSAGGFDLLVACDVFVYVGCLRAAFTAVGQLLHACPGSLFGFTTETMQARTAKDMYSFCLNADGRYEYTTGYISSLAREMKLKVCSRKETVLRKNLGVDVIGHVWVLSREDDANKM